MAAEERAARARLATRARERERAEANAAEVARHAATCEIAALEREKAAAVLRGRHARELERIERLRLREPRPATYE